MADKNYNQLVRVIRVEVTSRRFYYAGAFDARKNFPLFAWFILRVYVIKIILNSIIFFSINIFFIVRRDCRNVFFMIFVRIRNRFAVYHLAGFPSCLFFETIYYTLLYNRISKTIARYSNVFICSINPN